MGLSDYNLPEYNSTTSARAYLFSDLNLSLPIHPNKNDIIPLTDVDAIKQSLKNLVLTNFGEKLFKPNFGGNVTSYLFENVDVFTAVSIQYDINRAIKKFEKRVTDVTTQVIDNMDANSYNVTIGFRITNSTQFNSVEFALVRTR